MDVLRDVCEFDEFEGFEDVGGGDALVLLLAGHFVCSTTACHSRMLREQECRETHVAAVIGVVRFP